MAFNGLAPKGVFSLPGTEGLKEEDVKPGGGLSKADIDEARLGKVRVNEGDAWCVVASPLPPAVRTLMRDADRQRLHVPAPPRGRTL